MKKNIICVTAIHGNEYLPTVALASQGIAQCIGNPKALSQNKRFIDDDLNMSFGQEGNSYERKRGRELLELIDEKKIVIDFHTFSCISVPFAIVVDPVYIPLARTLGVPHVVYMKHSIKNGHALIDYRPGISIEVGQHNDPLSFDRTIEVYRHATMTGTKKLSDVLEVFNIITKPGNYTNFSEYHDENESFIPVLAGEQAYSFPGLKARRYNMNKQEHI